MLKENFKLFSAFIDYIVWSNKVAELFGYEWDREGAQLIDALYDDAVNCWGENGADFINDFINRKKSDVNLPETKQELWESLNKYFIKE